MRKSHRVFHLIKSLGRGGAEVLLVEGLRQADRNSFTYGYGYFLPWKDAMVTSLRDFGGEVVCFDCNHFGTMMLSLPKVVKFLKHWRADLIHCHLPLAGIVGRLAAYSCGIPVIYTEHNVLARLHPLTRRANLLTWKLQDWVIAVSQEVNDSIESYAGKSVPVSVVRNGIPLDTFTTSEEDRAVVRARWGIPETAPVVGTVAVFRPQKDLQNWLKAAQLVKSRYPGVHFLLVGDGPLMSAVKSCADRLGLADVHFAGLQQNVSPYYSAMDVYFSSSVFEGLPLAVLEAMATKLPVVATRVGGVPEVVLESKTGFLVDPNHPEESAAKICELLPNERMRREFGSAGRAVIEQQFSMKRMMDQIEQIYLQVLDKKPQSGYL